MHGVTGFRVKWTSCKLRKSAQLSSSLTRKTCKPNESLTKSMNKGKLQNKPDFEFNKEQILAFVELGPMHSDWVFWRYQAAISCPAANIGIGSSRIIIESIPALFQVQWGVNLKARKRSGSVMRRPDWKRYVALPSDTRYPPHFNVECNVQACQT